MALPKLSRSLLAIAALLSAAPAYAQFGSIFREEPPRPPADVPSSPPSNYPPPQQRNSPSQRPPAEARPDQAAGATAAGADEPATVEPPGRGLD